MRALFNEALDGSGGIKKGKTKKEKQKDQEAALKKQERDQGTLMKDYPFIADEMLAMTGMLNDMTPEELDAELHLFLTEGPDASRLQLEQVRVSAACVCLCACVPCVPVCVCATPCSVGSHLDSHVCEH